MSARTFYYVQPYSSAGQGVAPARLRQAATAGEAVSLAETLAERMVGVIAYSIAGDPQFDVWEDPIALARFGQTPS